MKQACVFFVTVLFACEGHNENKNKTPLSPGDDHKTYIISPIYPDTVFFMVHSVSGEQTIVNGKAEGFHNREKKNYELYFQRFVEKKDNFRVIHAVGNGIESISTHSGDSSRIYTFNDTIRFDELGNFKDTVDPVSLVPLYPGHAVKKGEEWKPAIPVRIVMGEGVAHYLFIIDSIFSDESASVLARVIVNVNASLQPANLFRDGTVTVSGGGWFVWDCTINQRRETHLNVTYNGKNKTGEVIQVITVDDNLKYYNGKKNF